MLRAVELPQDVTWAVERECHRILSDLGYERDFEWFPAPFGVASKALSRAIRQVKASVRFQGRTDFSAERLGKW